MRVTNNSGWSVWMGKLGVLPVKHVDVGGGETIITLTGEAGDVLTEWSNSSNGQPPRLFSYDYKLRDEVREYMKKEAADTSLRERIAELERKLAEQSVVINALNGGLSL